MDRGEKRENYIRTCSKIDDKRDEIRDLREEDISYCEELNPMAKEQPKNLQGKIWLLIDSHD